MPSLIQRLRSVGLLHTIKIISHFVRDSTNMHNGLKFGKLRIITSCDLGIRLPDTTVLPHPIGIVVGKKTDIGDNVKINQNVTLAGPVTVEDNVSIGTGAFVSGDITLHEGCVIGANSVVLDDVKAGTTVVGAPATEVNR